LRLRDSFESALRAIAANKLRSVLTMLGVVIGVGSVIAMIGIGEGTAKKSIENIEIMGTNMLTIMPNWRRGHMSGVAGEIPPLEKSDVESIKRGVPTIREATGVVRRDLSIKFGNRTHRCQVQGAEPQVAKIRNAERLYQGTWYTRQDEVNGERKVVLGYLVYQELFDDGNAIGASIRVHNQNFTVVGVVRYKGGSGGWNPDDMAYVPLSTAMTRLMGKTKLDMIYAQASRSDILFWTQSEVERVLSARRSSATGEELFRVMNQGEWIEQIETQTRLLRILLAGIASVSLLVGGIGIMNIMLVSVTERTREIGLRKAIGAKSGSVLSQFLLESIVMCLVGGLVGIALGSAGVVYVAGLLKVPPAVNVQAIVLAFGFSAMVGLFFGLYPALRASRLQPIEALRYE
jgi:putative ABC transport system permease protein